LQQVVARKAQDLEVLLAIVAAPEHRDAVMDLEDALGA